MTLTHRILVVEDDKAIQDILFDRLKERFDLTFAGSQSEAYGYLRTTQFDLVLLDLRLPTKPGDMAPANQVGIDILETIRRQRLVKRSSAMPMPVVIMTAHGSERLVPQLLKGEFAADYYIPKPFDTDNTLEHVLESAMAGELGGTYRGGIIRIAFKEPWVRIETLDYTGAHFELLNIVRLQYLDDLAALKDRGNFLFIKKEKLALELEITETALRKRIEKFRQSVASDFLKRLGRNVATNDILENLPWKGYRLNPWVVHILHWDELDPRPGGGDGQKSHL